MAKSKTGPKTNWKLTSETIGKLEYAFAIDASIAEACYFADINQDTYYRWIKENPELSERFARLRQQPVFKAREAVNSGIQDNPEFAFKYLIKKKRDEFGDSIDITSKGESISKVKIEIIDNNGA